MNYIILTYTANSYRSNCEFIRYFDNSIKYYTDALLKEDQNQESISLLKQRISHWVKIPDHRFHTLMFNIWNDNKANFYGYILNHFCKGDVVLVNIPGDYNAYFENPQDLLMLKLKA